MSQSSLSRAVADLERLLGLQLLERVTRNAQLTAADVEALRIASPSRPSPLTGLGLRELRR